MLAWLQTDWTLAMLIAAPLALYWGEVHRWRERFTHPRFLAWAVMLSASIACLIVPVEANYTNAAQNVKLAAWYMAIDGIAGALIIRGSKTSGACLGQFFIGLIFAGMVMFHAGFVAGANPAAVGSWLNAQLWAGWLQFAILLIWGGVDAGRGLYRGLRIDDRLAAYSEGR